MPHRKKILLSDSNEAFSIGLNIIVQNIQQIKALYEKEWESIIGNCDTLLFLGGGNEPTSLEFIVKLLGKETIATRTRGQTKGHSSSSSTNFQQTGRDLMTIDEVRKLDTHKAILFIRGEDPVLDKKYNIKRHPNIKLTTDGKAKPYMLLTNSLRERGDFRVFHARDADETTEVLHRHRPHVLLLDFLLPHKGGFHVMQQLREGGHKISTILMTALPTHKVIEEAYRLGASFVLPKPFTARALAERIHDALHSDRP